MKKINSIKEYKASERREKIKIIIIQFTLLISLLLSWELLTKYEILNSLEEEDYKKIPPRLIETIKEKNILKMPMNSEKWLK